MGVDHARPPNVQRLRRRTAAAAEPPAVHHKIFPPVSTSPPPLALIFGPFDPSGSSNLPADAVTCAQLGGHALGVLTAIHVQDTASIEAIQPVAPELIDDQARCLLEDMAVGAMKAGPLYTVESVSTIAQIVADYSTVPFVLHLGSLPDEEMLAADHDAEDLVGSLFELLLPQADVVIADHNLITLWANHGFLSAHGGGSPAEIVLEYQAKWALITGAPLRPGQRSYQLLGADKQTRQWPWAPPPERVMGTEGLLGCVVALELARGLDVPQAVEEAIHHTATLAGRSFQPGMGHRLINRSIS
ncbi:MAG: hydroxymethylpyrimidine/phosphomethylpyrimidine kinase [Candidimonas sp.]|nr:MAG: hydroxymethylpyrimidine/phosphomethylpyrimidine kinase [Candidimonas sp.]